MLATTGRRSRFLVALLATTALSSTMVHAAKRSADDRLAQTPIKVDRGHRIAPSVGITFGEGEGLAQTPIRVRRATRTPGMKSATGGVNPRGR